MSKNNINSIEWLIEKYTIVCGLGSKELMKEHIDRAKVMYDKEIEQAELNAKEIIIIKQTEHLNDEQR